jgi:hypothetical protein
VSHPGILREGIVTDGRGLFAGLVEHFARAAQAAAGQPEVRGAVTRFTVPEKSTAAGLRR